MYLCTTKNQGITYGLTVHDIVGHEIIYGYADADFATDLDSRKSTTGWVFMYNGGAISWRSHQQSVTALSTSEADRIYEFIGCGQGGPLIIKTK